MTQAVLTRSRRHPSVRVAAAAVALAALTAVGLDIEGLGPDTPQPALRSAPAGAPVRVTGLVAVEGGALVQRAKSDVGPVRVALPVRITGTTRDGRRLVRTLTTTTAGRFALRIPPGRYRFTAVLYPGAIPLSQEPHAVARVRPGEPRGVRILEHVL